MAPRRVLCPSSSNTVVAVKEVTHSHNTSMSYLDHLTMSAVNSNGLEWAGG